MQIQQINHFSSNNQLPEVMWVYLAPLFSNSNLFPATLVLCSLECGEDKEFSISQNGEFVALFHITQPGHDCNTYGVKQLLPDSLLLISPASMQEHPRGCVEHPQSWSWRQLHLIELLAPMFSSPMLKPTQHVPAFPLFTTIKTKWLFAVDHVIPTQSSTFLCPVNSLKFHFYKTNVLRDKLNISKSLKSQITFLKYLLL